MGVDWGGSGVTELGTRLKLVSRVKWEPLGTFFVAVGYVSDPMDVLLQYSDIVFAVVGCC